MAASVMTVLGPVDVADLGVTLPHEHLMLDLTCLWTAPSDPARLPLVDAPVEIAARGLLACGPYHSLDNLRLDNVDHVTDEIARFAALGGRTVVDLSTRSIGPYPRELAEIARRTGLHIVAGTGFYVRRAHPEWVAGATLDALTELMIRELREGFDGTAIRAGIIGEIGTRTPIDPEEEKVLRAAARAHLATGAGMNVHLAIFGREGHAVLDILERESVDPRYVALSHLDERPDVAYHRELAARGAFIEYDCFGSECYWDEDDLREPSDAERIEALLALLDAGLAHQLLLSQDICTKMQWRRHGGMGYDHILRTIVPRLRRRGVDEATLHTMLVENPARLLAGRTTGGAGSGRNGVR